MTGILKHLPENININSIGNTASDKTLDKEIASLLIRIRKIERFLDNLETKLLTYSEEALKEREIRSLSYYRLTYEKFHRLMLNDLEFIRKWYSQNPEYKPKNEDIETLKLARSLKQLSRKKREIIRDTMLELEDAEKEFEDYPIEDDEEIENDFDEKED